MKLYAQLRTKMVLAYRLTSQKPPFKIASFNGKAKTDKSYRVRDG